MTNTIELKYAILKAKKTNKSLSKDLGLNENTFAKKINNKSEFKASEIAQLTSLLDLSEEEKNTIFFGN